MGRVTGKAGVVIGNLRYAKVKQVRNAFQETNVVGVTRPITKHNFLVKDIRNLKYILEKAFFIAETGRPGPVVVDIPVDIQKELVKKEELTSFSAKDMPGYDPFPKLNPSLLKQAWQLIQKTKKPLIYAGGGLISSNAEKEFFDFVTKTNIPVATTILGYFSDSLKKSFCIALHF